MEKDLFCDKCGHETTHNITPARFKNTGEKIIVCKKCRSIKIFSDEKIVGHGDIFWCHVCNTTVVGKIINEETGQIDGCKFSIRKLDCPICRKISQKIV